MIVKFPAKKKYLFLDELRVFINEEQKIRRSTVPWLLI
jgi:hypothetical protein